MLDWGGILIWISIPYKAFKTSDLMSDYGFEVQRNHRAARWKQSSCTCTQIYEKHDGILSGSGVLLRWIGETSSAIEWSHQLRVSLVTAQAVTTKVTPTNAPLENNNFRMLSSTLTPRNVTLRTCAFNMCRYHKCLVWRQHRPTTCVGVTVTSPSAISWMTFLLGTVTCATQRAWWLG